MLFRPSEEMLMCVAWSNILGDCPGEFRIVVDGCDGLIISSSSSLYPL